MTYHVEILPPARRQLDKLTPDVRTRLQGAIALLAHDPRPPRARQLRGRPHWRIRVGDYRVIYAIEDERLLVVVCAPP